MAIDPKDVYVGMKIVRNAEFMYEGDDYKAYSGSDFVRVKSMPTFGGHVETDDGAFPSLRFMDVYVEPEVETFAGFKVGDRVRLVNACNMGAEIGAEAVINEFTGEGDKPVKPYLYLNLVWDRNTPFNRQNDGGYYPKDFELAEKAPDTSSKPFVLTVGTLTFDSLESLSQAISEGLVSLKQEKTIRVKDGWVNLEDKVWWHGEYGPEEVLVDNDMYNIRVYPEIYSIKKPEWIPASSGRYTGNYCE